MRPRSQFLVSARNHNRIAPGEGLRRPTPAVAAAAEQPVGWDDWPLAWGIPTFAFGARVPGDLREHGPVRRHSLYINRGGQIWKSLFRTTPVAPIVALLGVVYLPGSDDQTAAVQLTVTGAPAGGTPVSQRIDPGREPQTLHLPTAGANWNRVVLEIRSQAAGTLSIANVIREYRLA